MNREDPSGLGIYVPKKNLLLAAGIFMGVAGFMVLRTGILAAETGWPIGYILIALGKFVLFMLMFIKYFRKNRDRILAFRADEVGLFNFFDAKGYFTMIFMITLGMTFRYIVDIAGLPVSIVQTFYSGLGVSLFITGILFLLEYRKASA
jgi:hypothetical protein